MEVSALCCVAAALAAQGSPGPPPPAPLGVTAAASDDAVPIGASLEFNGAVTGGTAPVNVRHESFYGDAPCRAGTELGDGEAVGGTHSAPMTLFAAGAHEVVVTATDSSNPPLTATVTVTVTGQPPDTLTPDAGENDCVFFGFANMFHEVIRIDTFAGQERMGPLYTNGVAWPQEQVEFTWRNFNGVTDQYLDTWEDWEIPGFCQDVNGNIRWAPDRPNGLQALYFVELHGTTGEGSYVHDEKGASFEPPGATDREARAANAATRPAGFAFAAQRQRVRVQFTRGCVIDYAETGVFYPTLVTTGVLGGDGTNFNQTYRDFGDWIINTTDPR